MCPKNCAGHWLAGTRYALPNATEKLKAVRKCQPHVRNVGGIHYHFVRELPLAARSFGSEQVTLAGIAPLR